MKLTDSLIKRFLNIELSSERSAALDKMWEDDKSLILADHGFYQDSPFSIYALLRALTKSCRIIIAASSFRESKFIFEDIENIYEDSIILKDICTLRRDIDRCTVKIMGSQITCLPIQYIKGLKTDYVIADYQAASMMGLEFNRQLVITEDDFNLYPHIYKRGADKNNKIEIKAGKGILFMDNEKRCFYEFELSNIVSSTC